MHSSNRGRPFYRKGAQVLMFDTPQERGGELHSATSNRGLGAKPREDTRCYLHRSSDRPGGAYHDGRAKMDGLVENDAEDRHDGRDSGEKRSNGAEEFDDVRFGNDPAQRQLMQALGWPRKINAEIEADGAVDHDGEDGRGRAKQVDVRLCDMCGDKQTTRHSSQGKSRPLHEMCNFARGGTVAPRFAMRNHIIKISGRRCDL